MNRKRLENDKQDIELTLALLDDLESEGAALTEWEQGFSTDSFYQKALPPLKRRSFPNRSIQSVRLTRRKAVLFTIIVILSVSLLAGSVSGAVSVFFDWIACSCERGADLSIRSGEGSAGMEWDFAGYYRPEYIPEGYCLTDVESDGDSAVFIYSNENQRVAFWQVKGGWGSLQDQEHSKTPTEIFVNGQNGLLFQEGDSFRLLWGKNPRFSLQAEISEEELLKIAESVKYVP